MKQRLVQCAALILSIFVFCQLNAVKEYWVNLDVSDNQVGLDPKKPAKIFMLDETDKALRIEQGEVKITRFAKATFAVSEKTLASRLLDDPAIQAKINTQKTKPNYIGYHLFSARFEFYYLVGTSFNLSH